MKVCILKQPYVTEFTWSTHRWSNAQELLDNFVHRSQNFGLVCETKADIWVVEDGKYVSDTYANLLIRVPDAVEALYRSHTTHSWNEVPWQEYDVVISLDQIIPDQIITQYPEILWCYYEQEHVMASFRVSANQPYGKYDLFLNHELSSSTFSTTYLPRSINFPYLCSSQVFSQVVSSEKQDCVYLDSHCIRGISDLKQFRVELRQKFGINVTHSKPWNFNNSYRSVGDKEPSSTQEYLNQVASCKYFLLNRGGPSQIGQSAPEMAALGVILLSDRLQRYSHYLCHPEAWVKPRDFDSAAEVIRKIQDNRDLRREILEYQYEKVQDFFLDYPLKVLHQCLEIKRGITGKHFFLPPMPDEAMRGIARQRVPFLKLWEERRASLFAILKNPLKYFKILLREIKPTFSAALKRRIPPTIRTKLIDLRQRFKAYATIAQDERVRCQKLSVIFTGRNDSYATDFRERMMAAINVNQAEAAKRNLDVEWIFVEWNPLSQDYLSYQLAQKGFQCYVVSSDIHKRIVSPRVAQQMSFMQFFAKNIGIKRATGNWVLVTNADCIFDDNVWDYIANEALSPTILYRAERHDVAPAYFGKSFESMRANVTRCHSVKGGKDFAQGAGDFVLFSSQNLMGYDEQINFSDAHLDARFCMNWSALRSKDGDLGNQYFFKFIGQVFKGDHELTFVKTHHLDKHHKGLVVWNSTIKIGNGTALYENEENWGFVNEPQTELCQGVWYIG